MNLPLFNKDSKSVEATSFFPIHSLHPDFITPGQEPKEALATIFKNLVKKGLYSEKKRQWNIPKQKDWTEEYSKASFFNLLVEEGYANGVSNQVYYVWREHGQLLSERLRKPDVVLVPTSHEKIERVNFRDMQTVCEVKYKDTKVLIREALFQIFELAGFICATQLPRRFCIVFSLCGSTLTLLLYARGATVVSSNLNIDQHPQEFLQILLGLTSCSAIWNGRDENFLYNPTRGLMLTIGEYSIRITNRPIFVSLSAQTKSTKVWLCEVVVCGSRVNWAILKDCWMEADLTSDIDIHKWLVERKPTRYANSDEKDIFGKKDKFNIHKGCHQLCVLWDDKVNLRGIPIVLVSEKVNCFNPGPRRSQLGGKIADSTDNILCRLNVPDLAMQSRIHIRVVYETIGVPLTWFSCRREFLKVIMGAAVGLFNGTRKKILQCDASDTNVLIIVEDLEPERVVPDWPHTGYTKRGGMLGDWGYAEDRDPKRIFPTTKGNKTGTFPFTAAELLSDDDQMNEQGTHEIYHDLESLFWIMWIAAVNLEGPFNQRREWRSTTAQTAEPFLGNIRRPVVPSPNINGVPAWAAPGLHTCSRGEVYEWKRAIPDILFKSCMCTYWTDNTSGAAFLDGMEKLAGYFRHIGHQDPVSGKFVTSPPPERITPTIFIQILHDMHEAIPPQEDRPTDQQIQEGRAKYQNLLQEQTGLQASILDQPGALVRSQSNRGSTRQSKRATRTASVINASARQIGSKRPPEEPAPVAPSKSSKRSRRDLPQESSGNGQAGPA